MDFTKLEHEDPAEGQVPANSKPSTLSTSLNTIHEKNIHKIFVLGIVQVINGIVLILLFGVGFIIGMRLDIVPAFFMGIFVIICGVIGIISKRKKSKRYIVTYMILSIISAVFICSVIFMAANGVDSYWRDYRHFQNDNSTIYDQIYDYRIDQPREEDLAVYSIFLIFGLIEMIVAIIASAFGCGMICCNRQRTQAATIDMSTQNVVLGNS